ncbi:TrbG/VirB9 family P-type conjugative transfer protein [Cysteiniphilum litorale]|uniref:TrbG/VirB9 family P-type conjugative transfer protein n=1 Tax=Cysteiniphilum litorale TaxID=2056700 RepID=UPI003F88107B
METSKLRFKKDKKAFRVTASVVLGGALLMLSGCASMNQNAPLDYHHLDYVPSDSAALLNQDNQDEHSISLITPSYNYFSATGFANSKDIAKAFELYKTKGIMSPIVGTGFITEPFDPYSRTIISCSPNQSAEIMLEAGEKIQGVHIDNAGNWEISQMKTGAVNGSIMLIITPKNLDDSTNLTIATDMRTYSIGLVSHKAVVPIINFWYPDQIEADYSQQIQAAQSQKERLLSNTVSTTNDYAELDHLNFNYQVKSLGQPLENMPKNIYSDGKQMVFDWSGLNADNLPEVHAYLLGKDRVMKSKYSAPYLYVAGVHPKVTVTFKDMPQSRLEITNDTLNKVTG